MPMVGCNETAGEPCLPGTCPCQRPLDHYCEGSACPTYEQAITNAKGFVRDCYEGFGYSSAAGRCGDFRYVHTNDNLADSNTEYFDAAGTLVFARWCTDACGEVCRGSCCVDYGVRPECELEEEQNFCVDNLCRDWCANEPNGVSCHQGPPQSVQGCHEDCLAQYQENESRWQCGDESMAIKHCQVVHECEDPDASCDDLEFLLTECRLMLAATG
jgi:hypothetical protein